MWQSHNELNAEEEEKVKTYLKRLKKGNKNQFVLFRKSFKIGNEFEGNWYS